MFIVFSWLCLLKLVFGLRELDQWCIQDNNGTLENSYLLGTWYEIYKFAPYLNLPPSSACLEINITAVTPEDLTRYIAFHGNHEPLKMDNTAVMYESHMIGVKGMLTGGNEVKFFAWDPKSVFGCIKDYVSHAFRKINNEYLLYNSCVLWSSKFLWSRRRNQTAAELLDVISTIKEVKRLETQRLCAERYK